MRLNNMMQNINLDDKDQIIWALFGIAIALILASSFGTISPDVINLVNNIISGFLGMAIGTKWQKNKN